MSADDPVRNSTGQRIRDLARVSNETADSARALLAIFRGLPGGTDSARAHLVLSGGLTDTDGQQRGSMGDYESFHGLLEALERRVAQDGPWWTVPQAAGPGSS